MNKGFLNNKVENDMNKLISIVAGMLVLVAVYAADLSQSSLQGDWVITESMGEAGSGNDMWQFEGDQFYQNLEGHRISPDKFTVAPGVIDLDYSKITVTHFDGKVMHAEWAGIKYKLEKK
jgi:hypothetical protein